MMPTPSPDGAPSPGGAAESTLSFVASLPTELAEAVRAAAVPHWFDAPILAAILETPLERAQKLMSVLPLMPVTQPSGEGQYALHDLARQALLADLWQEQREQYQIWSRRAAVYFGRLAGDRHDPRLRIECVYHRLLSDPNQGADEVWNWGAEWHNTFQYAQLFALVQAGLEHDAAGRLAGRVRGWIYYLYALYQLVYNEFRDGLRALQSALPDVENDRQLEATCIKSLGDVHLRLAEYNDARARYEEARPIYAAIGARVGEANCIQSLGDVHLELGDDSLALATYADAYNRYLALGLRSNAAGALTSQTNITDRRKDYAASLTLYTQVIDLDSVFKWYKDPYSDNMFVNSLSKVQRW